MNPKKHTVSRPNYSHWFPDLRGCIISEKQKFSGMNHVWHKKSIKYSCHLTSVTEFNVLFAFSSSFLLMPTNIQDKLWKKRNKFYGLKLIERSSKVNSKYSDEIFGVVYKLIKL